jgi:hypothetical protein
MSGTPQFTRRRNRASNELPALVLPPVVNSNPVGDDPVAPAVAHDAAPLPKSCPKCGKTGRGLHFHMKACNGNVRRD